MHFIRGQLLSFIIKILKKTITYVIIISRNYYFFAQIKSSNKKEIISNEGNLKWFNKDEIINLNMPFTAKYILEHYFETGINNDIIYGGVANGEKIIFTELPEF